MIKNVTPLPLLKLVAGLFLSLFLASAAWADECGAPISVEAVQKLPQPLTLGQLTTILGKWCLGHGGVSWYRTGVNKEISFWWKNRSAGVIDQAEVSGYQVIVATESDAEDDNIQEIIWPPELVGQHFIQVLSQARETQ